LHGSHEFPGPDGGTCVAEAAIVAAGFSYRPVDAAGRCPSCFSRPLTHYAMRLNDAVDDELRQELLLPVVVRLAGSADAVEVESQRVRLVLGRTMTEILAPALAAMGFGVIARICRKTADDPIRFRHWVDDRRRSGRPMPPSLLTCAFDYMADAATELSHDPLAAARLATEAARTTADCIGDIGLRNFRRADVYREMAAILDAALLIGNQSFGLTEPVIVTRMEAAKRTSRAPTMA
jgi:hypothetical protein